MWTFAVLQEIVILTEHSKNKIIIQSELFENEIGPRILQSSIQQTQTLEEYKRHKQSATRFVSIQPVLCEIFANCMFLKAGLELSRCNLVSKYVLSDFIFGMLYCTFKVDRQRSTANIGHAEARVENAHSGKIVNISINMCDNQNL